MEENVTRSQVAIIGMGFEGPGAQNVDELWKILENGENHVTDIPPDRWNNAAFYSPDPDTPGKSYVTKAGFVSRYVKGVDCFDKRLLCEVITIFQVTKYSLFLTGKVNKGLHL